MFVLPGWIISAPCASIWGQSVSAVGCRCHYLILPAHTCPALYPDRHVCPRLSPLHAVPVGCSPALHVLFVSCCWCSVSLQCCEGERSCRGCQGAYQVRVLQTPDVVFLRMGERLDDESLVRPCCLWLGQCCGKDVSSPGCKVRGYDTLCGSALWGCLFFSEDACTQPSTTRMALAITYKPLIRTCLCMGLPASYPTASFCCYIHTWHPSVLVLPSRRSASPRGDGCDSYPCVHTCSRQDASPSPPHSCAHSLVFSHPSTQLPMPCTHCTCVLALAMLWVGILGDPSQHLFPITPPTPPCTQEAAALPFPVPLAWAGAARLCVRLDFIEVWGEGCNLYFCLGCGSVRACPNHPSIMSMHA
jgi:hypothetical protein